MRKATTKLLAGALCAALVLTGVSVPERGASAASAKLNKNNVVLYKGGNATAKVKAKNVNQVTYKSKDTSVATVNSTTGKIKAKGPGKTKVVAKTDAGKFKCKVRVYKAIKTLTTDTTEVTLAPGETKTVGVTVKPAKADTSMWKIATSDKSVAKKKKANGQKGTFDIIGVAAGTATITVSSTDGGSAPAAAVRVNVAGASADADADEDLAADTSEEIQYTVELLNDATALTKSDAETLYIWYATYNEADIPIINPSFDWTVADAQGNTSVFNTTDRSDLGCLVVDYADISETEEVIYAGSFSAGDTVMVTAANARGEVVVDQEVTVGETRYVAGADNETIYKTNAAGEVEDIGNTLPVGFESDGNTYELGFTAYDQNGNIMLDLEVAAWNDEAGRLTPSDGIVPNDAPFLEAEWNQGDTPAAIGNLYTEATYGAGWYLESAIIDETYVNLFVIDKPDWMAGGMGTAYFVLQNADWQKVLEFRYIVGTDASLVSLELVQPEDVVCDGDRDVEIPVNGIFEDGSVWENMPWAEFAKVAEREGKDISNMSAEFTGTGKFDGAGAEEAAVWNPVTYDADGNMDGDSGTWLTWSDGYDKTEYDTVYAESESDTGINSTTFDRESRFADITLTGCPYGVNTLSLEIEDARYPVMAAQTWDQYPALTLSLYGNDGEVLGGCWFTFISQYGDEMPAAAAQASMSGVGYMFTGEEEAVYYGVLLDYNRTTDWIDWTSEFTPLAYVGGYWCYNAGGEAVAVDDSTKPLLLTSETEEVAGTIEIGIYSGSVESTNQLLATDAAGWEPMGNELAFSIYGEVEVARG